jgi:hypothetical protein
MKRTTASNDKAHGGREQRDIADQIAIPGARPTKFKLKWRAPGSYFVYRSGRRLGTAREEDGIWTACFDAEGHGYEAHAPSPHELLHQLATFLLLIESHEAVASIGQVRAEAGAKRKLGPEERLSLKFEERARAVRLADIDAKLKALSMSVRKRTS